MSNQGTGNTRRRRAGTRARYGRKYRLVRDVKVGMLADLVLLSDNISAVPSEELAGVRVAMTVVDGRVVYER